MTERRAPDQHASGSIPLTAATCRLAATAVSCDHDACKPEPSTIRHRPFYHVAVDSRKPYHIYGGLQDNCSWGGPSRGNMQGGFGGPGEGTGPLNEDWIMLGGGDGFVCRVDPNDPDIVYWESQDGNIGRRNLRTGTSTAVRPRALPQVEVIDWKKPFLISFGKIPMIVLAPSVTKKTPPFRFNWNTPFILSQHNSKIFYSAGNYVFRSVKQGDELVRLDSAAIEDLISQQTINTKKAEALMI